MNLFAELKRRNVFRVGMAYALVAWLLIQAADILLGNFGAPQWVFRSFAVLMALGFPLALFLAWAYELTPEGVRRSGEVHAEESPRPESGRRLDWLILAGMGLVVAVVLADRIWSARSPGPDVKEAQSAAPADPAERRPITERSIAVLPFADLSPTGDQAYFADGIAEELLNALSRVGSLRVAGRSSSFHFRGRSEHLRAIGEILHVAYVLEGSVRKSAERVRITAQLVSTHDGFHLWSETYDGELKDIFDLQERIARAITSELEVVLDGKQQERIVDVATENTEAFALFLQATAIFNRRDRDRLGHAAELLEEAIRLDPEFTRARSRLAAVLLVAPSYAPVDSDEYFAAAERHARIAISQDDSLAEPHAVLGLLFASHRRYSAAHAEFLRALELDPADVTSNFWYGIHLWMAGYREHAEQRLDKVLEVDPMLPNGLNWRALGFLSRGDTQTARRLYQRAYDLGFAGAAQGLSLLAELDGDRELAARLQAEVMSEAFAIPHGASAAEVIAAGIYGDPKDREMALDLIDDYLASVPARIHGHVPNALLRMGRPDQALELAAPAALINESLFFAPLWSRPFGDAARQSPYFPEFARRTGLAEYWRQHGSPDGCQPQPDGDFVCE
jgi:TolB-like protein